LPYLARAAAARRRCGEGRCRRRRLGEPVHSKALVGNEGGEIHPAPRCKGEVRSRLRTHVARDPRRRTAPFARPRGLTRNGACPRVADHVAPLEIVGARRLGAVALPSFAFAPADDGRRLAEHEVLAERILPIASMKTREDEL